MKSFLQGRPFQDASPLRPLATVANEGLNKPKSHAHNESAGPTVECIKQGEKVVRLIVTCSCGERIEIECLYPAGG